MNSEPTLQVDRTALTLPVMVNRSAGAGAAERRVDIETTFRAAGIDAIVSETEPDGLRAALQEAVKAGTRVVAVAGGDGTISTAADVLQDSTTALLPVPLGTRNHFATRYGIGSVEAAAKALHEGFIAMVPIGLVNGRAFVNNASCGFYPHVVRHRDQMRGWLSKWPAGLIAALWVLIKRPLLDVELHVDDHQIARRTVAVWVGIGRDSLRLPEAGDVEKQGHVLEIVIPRTTRRLRLLAAAIRVYARLHRARYTTDPINELFRAHSFALNSDTEIDIALDGEDLRMGRKLQFEYRRDALRVVCLSCPEPR